MAIALKTAAGKFIKNSSGKFLSKYEIQTEFDASLTNSTIPLSGGRTLYINNTGSSGPTFSADFDLRLVAIDDYGDPVHCHGYYVELDWAMNGNEIYIYDIDIYAEYNWMSDGIMGDAWAEGEWMVDNLTPIAVLQLDLGDVVWRLL